MWAHRTLPAIKPATIIPVPMGREKLKDLGTPSAESFGSANWINDAGEVVGDAYVQGDQSAHPFLWKNGRVTDMGLPAGATCANATSINSQGQIVGISGNVAPMVADSCGRTAGPLYDLNSLIPPAQKFK